MPAALRASKAGQLGLCARVGAAGHGITVTRHCRHIKSEGLHLGPKRAALAPRSSEAAGNGDDIGHAACIRLREAGYGRACIIVEAANVAESLGRWFEAIASWVKIDGGQDREP